MWSGCVGADDGASTAAVKVDCVACTEAGHGSEGVTFDVIVSWSTCEHSGLCPCVGDHVGGSGEVTDVTGCSTDGELSLLLSDVYGGCGVNEALDGSDTHSGSPSGVPAVVPAVGPGSLCGSWALSVGGAVVSAVGVVSKMSAVTAAVGTVVSAPLPAGGGCCGGATGLCGSWCGGRLGGGRLGGGGWGSGLLGGGRLGGGGSPGGGGVLG